MGSVSATRVAALLLLLGAALATVPGRPTVMDIRNGWGARGQGVSVASTKQAGAQEGYGYSDYGVEEKEVCLQEVNRRDCHKHWVEACNSANGVGGCTTIGSGVTGDGNCDCDATTSFWTSELTCCHDKHEYNYGHGSASVGDHLWGGSRGTIGTCDWTMHYVDTSSDIAVSTYIRKLGSASAICYFGVDSQECGGPFCERMVMSLEGYVYYVSKVYSYWGETDTSSGDGKEGDCDVIDPFNDRLDRNAGNAKKVPQSTDKNVVDKTKASPVKPSAASSDASAQYYEGGHYDNKPVFAGEAAVINGVVTTMAGPRKEKYDSAVFEFVVAYDQTSNAAVTALDPNVAWVHDKAMKFTFYKQSSY